MKIGEKVQSDFTTCKGYGCPKKTGCKRYTEFKKGNSERVVLFISPYYTVAPFIGKCDYYIEEK
jgi:hypothetical protein